MLDMGFKCWIPVVKPLLKSSINATIYQEILDHSMLASAEQLYWDADFIFQQDLAFAHTAKSTKSS